MNLKTEPQFTGIEAVPQACPRERCGQPVAVYFPIDPTAPGTWSCVSGHGGVLNKKPDLERRQVPENKSGMCRRCGVRPVPPKRVRGGFRGHYCTECIDEGRSDWGER